MSIIKNIKEQRQRDKKEFFRKLDETKEYTQESFSKEHREKVLEENVARMKSPEMKELNKIQYTTHMKLLLLGFISLIIGMIFPPLLLLAAILLVSSLICMAKNWNKINGEYKQRKKIK